MRIKRALRGFFVFMGGMAFIYILMSFLGAPHMVEGWLSDGKATDRPDYIVLLPAGDIPNPYMLMRAYYAAEVFKRAKGAKVIISMNANNLPDSSIWRIRQELILRGVSPSAILLETKARNTREHAVFIREAGFGNISEGTYLLVTSPAHIKRAALAFRASGFRNVFVCPARTKQIMGDIGDDIGKHRFLRYGLWEEMETGIVVLRELTALVYYKARGWI